MSYKYLFGPVPSRRLGISLGVDLVPHKTCSLDCIYCECGDTDKLVIERKEYVPLKEVLAELREFLDSDPNLDFITFSGSGEPTLHIYIGEVVKFIKNNYPQYKICLLTNSTLLYDKKLRDEIMDVDLIVPSLDAVSEDAFSVINRPISDLTADMVIEGLLEFCSSFKGRVWVELFIVPEINDNKEELAAFKTILEKIRPEKVQLNSLDRPGTVEWIRKASSDTMSKIKEYLEPLNVEIVAKYNQSVQGVFENARDSEKIENAIISTIKRRPCTLEDLVSMTGLPKDDVSRYIKDLSDKGKIETYEENRGVFFRVV